MTFFFTPHARTRARERYGLELTTADFGGISSAIRGGEAVRVGSSDRGDTFAWKLCDTYVFPVVKQGVIITFMPPDFMLVSRRRMWQKSRYRKLPPQWDIEEECV